MKTYCFKIYYPDVDTDDIVYIGAGSKKEAIAFLKDDYGDIDYDFLGIE